MNLTNCTKGIKRPWISLAPDTFSAFPDGRHQLEKTHPASLQCQLLLAQTLASQGNYGAWDLKKERQSLAPDQDHPWDWNRCRINMN